MDLQVVEFPNMKDKANVTLGHRSGLMMIGLLKE